MTRALHNDVITAINGNRVRTAYLFELSLSEPSTGELETLYATNNNYDITYEGFTYSSVGFLLSVEGIEEFTDSRISSVTVSLAGISETVLGTLLSYDYIDKPLKIKRVFVDDNTHIGEGADDVLDSVEGDSVQIIGEPVVIFEGGTEKPTITESQSKGYLIVTLSASSKFAEFESRNGRHTNPAEQKFYDPSDRIFEQVGKIDPNLVWGKED